MPEATVLYSVTAVVIAGLILWVAFVLKTAKEPWAREAPMSGELTPEMSSANTTDADEAVEAVANAKKAGAAKLDADSTARATPLALSEGRRTAAAANDKSDQAQAVESESEEKEKDESKAEV